MPRAYCTIEDVTRYLPDNVRVEGTNPLPDPFDREPETLLTINIQFYILQASSVIESALKSLYDVPFRLVNEGGVRTYPTPLPQINALLAAMMIYEQRLQGADRARSDSQKERSGVGGRGAGTDSKRGEPTGRRSFHPWIALYPRHTSERSPQPCRRGPHQRAERLTSEKGDKPPCLKMSMILF